MKRSGWVTEVLTDATEGRVRAGLGNIRYAPLPNCMTTAYRTNFENKTLSAFYRKNVLGARCAGTAARVNRGFASPYTGASCAASAAMALSSTLTALSSTLM